METDNKEFSRSIIIKTELNLNDEDIMISDEDNYSGIKLEIKEESRKEEEEELITNASLNYSSGASNLNIGEATAGLQETTGGIGAVSSNTGDTGDSGIGDLSLFTQQKLNVCDICKAEYTLISDFKYHKVTFHSETKHMCTFCFESLFQNVDFTRDTECGVHSEIYVISSFLSNNQYRRQFGCGNCKKRFGSIRELNNHYGTDTVEKRFKCDVCKECFITLSQLKIHERNHFECAISNSATEGLQESTSGNIGTVSTNTGDTGDSGIGDLSLFTKYKCDICKAEFGLFSDFKYHNITRHSERKHLCTFCHKTFFKREVLVCHFTRSHAPDKSIGQRFHTEIFVTSSCASNNHVKRNFECGTCKKRYTAIGELKNHYGTDLVGKWFKCDICKEYFTTFSQLNIHARTHRPTGEPPFKCVVCKECFTTSEQFNTHKWTHIERPFECVTCKTRFFTKSSANIHSLTCRYRLHIGEKSFECAVCKECFNTCNQLKTHTRRNHPVRPFECVTCKTRFATKSSLYSHYPIHSWRN